ncbi:MAG: hypothetical protein AB7N65_16875 [Vicinamibacterales bacterium]
MKFRPTSGPARTASEVRNQRDQRDRERKALDARLAAAVRARQLKDERRMISGLWARGDQTGALRLLVESLIREHQIAVEWTSDPRRAAAIPARRWVRIGPIVDPFAAAIALHEIAHVVRGHHTTPDPIPDEMDAWAVVSRLAPDGLSRAMHAAMRAGLRSYVRADPDHPRASAIERMTGTTAWASDRLARLRFRDREQKQATVMASIARTTCASGR